MKRKVMKFAEEEFFEPYPVEEFFAGAGAVQIEECGNSHRIVFASPGLGGCGPSSDGPLQVVSKVLLCTEDLSALAHAIAQYLIGIAPGEKGKGKLKVVHSETMQ